MSEILQSSGERQELVLNMGPHHPSTHGVLRFVVHTDGEIMRRAVPDIGYLHRGLEKLAEGCSWAGYMPFTDRVNYLEAMFTNLAYARAVEKLLALEIPPRAQYLRVMACELNRIASHCITLGCIAMDLGAFTPFVYLLRERETINDLIEELCGNRITHNYMRIGGVAFDVDESWLKKVSAFLYHFEPVIAEFESLIVANEILAKRMAGVGVICAADAVAWGLVGPNLRASGVDFDLRRDQPYAAYDGLQFSVPVGRDGWVHPDSVVGDCYQRFLVRVEEMRQACKILRQCIAALPSGEIMAKVPKALRPPRGEAYAAVEGARGEIGCYVVSDGGPQPYRVKWRSSSFSSMSIIEHISRGLMIADLVAVIATLDVIAPETDR